MLEFALVIGVVLLFVIGIIDISLYFHGLTTVRETARRITKQAVVNSDFGIDTRSFTTPAISPSVDSVNKVAAARQRIINQAIAFSRRGLISHNFETSGHNGKTRTYFYANDGYQNPAAGTNELYALLLRPGERALSSDKENGTEVASELIVHPNCIPGDPNSALCRDYLRKPGSDAWNFMQRNFPYFVEVRAKINTIIAGEIEVTSRSLAWRDIAKTSSPDEFAEVPPPLTCGEAYPDADAYCATNCGSPEACIFFPGNLLPEGCFTCKTCEEFTSADEVCTSCGGAGGNSTENCEFNAGAANNAGSCGGCSAKQGRCEEFTSADEICAACGGENGDADEECHFNENGEITAGGDTTVCGGCIPKTARCDEVTDAATVCATCGGESGNATQECQFNPGTNVNIGGSHSACGGCAPRYDSCSELTDADSVCASCGGEAGNTLEECVFDEDQQIIVGGSTLACGGCRFRLCEDVFPGHSGAIDDTEAAGIPECSCDFALETCTFQNGNTVDSGCFSCGTKQCRDRFTPAEIEAYCDAFEAANPGLECVFNPNSFGANCFGSQNKTCEDRIAAGLIDLPTLCAACNIDTEICTELAGGSRGDNCIRCDVKPCPDRDLDLDVECESACNLSAENCDPVNGLPQGGQCVTCTAKTCEEAGVSEADVCGASGCPFGSECQFNPNADVGNCGGCQVCPPVNCSESNGETQAPNGCGCISCVPDAISCPRNLNIVVGCTCIPKNPL